MTDMHIQGATKVFGHDPERARPLVEQGLSKADIQEQTGLVLAVREVTFDVREGEIFVVMGLSGSGKSTLVRMLNGLFTPTWGSVLIGDRDITKLSEDDLRAFRARDISMVFQHFALFPHRTVLENAGFGPQVQGASREEREERSREALRMVGLEGWEDSYPSQLSGGMQQRVGLARALASNASIMLMDEAFSALDPLIRREMQDQLLELQESLGRTIVFITHDLNEAMRIGDRIAVMRDGEVVQIGTSEEILTAPATDYVAAFIQDVDPTRVLTASSIMREPQAFVSPRVGPHVAVRRMEELQRTDLYLMTPDHHVHGWITDRDLAEAVKRGDTSLQGIARDGYPRARPDTSISELFALAVEHTLPVAVIDESERLVGVVPRVALLAAQARSEHAPNGGTPGGEGEGDVDAAD